MDPIRLPDCRSAEEERAIGGDRAPASTWTRFTEHSSTNRCDRPPRVRHGHSGSGTTCDIERHAFNDTDAAITATGSTATGRPAAGGISSKEMKNNKSLEQRIY